MSDDDLVERVARAIRARVWLSDIGLDLDMVKCASMAVRSIEAIEAAGYVVVPREPTEKMVLVGYDYRNPAHMWRAMIAALEKDKANVR